MIHSPPSAVSREYAPLCTTLTLIPDASSVYQESLPVSSDDLIKLLDQWGIIYNRTNHAPLKTVEESKKILEKQDNDRPRVPKGALITGYILLAGNGLAIAIIILLILIMSSKNLRRPFLFWYVKVKYMSFYYLYQVNLYIFILILLSILSIN